jgi:hypothetical protein
MYYALVIAGLVAIVVAIYFVRSYMQEYMNPSETTSGPGFTLGDLRDLHRQGAMTDAEFERAKALLIGDVKAKAAEDANKAAEATKAAGRRPPANPRYRPPT